MCVQLIDLQEPLIFERNILMNSFFYGSILRGEISLYLEHACKNISNPWGKEAGHKLKLVVLFLYNSTGDIEFYDIKVWM